MFKAIFGTIDKVDVCRHVVFDIDFEYNIECSEDLMNSFYQSLFDNIHALLVAGKTALAADLIEQELAIPYVPMEVETQLQDLLIQCKGEIEVVSVDYGAKLDTLISGNIASKEKAVSVLKGLNLRNHHDHVQALLNDLSLLAEFKGELILELIRQRVDDDYTMIKDGLTIEFNPSLLTNDLDDPTIQKTRQLFRDWLSNGLILTEDFANQLLDQEILETLPFDFEHVDPISLAAAIVRLVFLSMKDEAGWDAFAKNHQLDDIKSYPLRIERRGE